MNAPTNVEPPASDSGDDSGDGGDDGDDGEAEEPAEPKDGEEVNMIDGELSPFICLNARFLAYSAGAVAASMAMLY